MMMCFGLFVLFFRRDDDGFYSLLFSKDHLPAGADPASKLDDTFVDLNDIETIVSSDLVF